MSSIYFQTRKAAAWRAKELATLEHKPFSVWKIKDPVERKTVFLVTSWQTGDDRRHEFVCRVPASGATPGVR